jgi:hypothetical protein
MTNDFPGRAASIHVALAVDPLLAGSYILHFEPVDAPEKIF